MVLITFSDNQVLFIAKLKLVGFPQPRLHTTTCRWLDVIQIVIDRRVASAKKFWKYWLKAVAGI